MSDQIICFERDMDTLSEKNAKLICKNYIVLFNLKMI